MDNNRWADGRTREVSERACVCSGSAWKVAHVRLSGVLHSLLQLPDSCALPWPPSGVCKWCSRTGLCNLGGWAPLFLRHVLERAVTQKLSTHKMKSLFKKFLSFEETHGTPELVTNVRQLALNYVEASTGT
uniref:(California timema) hypothetical protein n=1 Tax=Timema californicum TaxID=61474 RepID=A0A7R9IYS6_TIMCA|nr:unnamed protein product [Timema californicum]